MNTDVYLILMLAGSISFTYYLIISQVKLKRLNKTLTIQSLEYDSVIKNANCGILHVKRKGKIKQINSVFEVFLGKKIKDIEEFFALLSTEQYSLFQEFLQAGEDSNFELTFLSYQKKEINLSIYLSFVPQNNDIIIVAISLENKLKLQKTLNKFQVFFNHSDLGHIILDEEFNIVDVNESLCKLSQYSAEELLFKNISLFFKTPLLFTHFKKKYLNNPGLEEVSNLEYRFIKKDHSTLWIEIFGKKFKEGNKTYSIWSIRDITLRVNSRNTIKKLNVKLQQEFDKLEKIINVIPIPIFIKDKKFNYIRCNEAFCKFLNRPKEAILNKTVFEIFDSFDEAKQYDEKDKEMYELDFQRYKTHFEKTQKTIEIQKTSLWGQNKSFNGFVGVIIDLTKQENEKNYLEKRVQEELEKNKQAREKHQKEQLRNVKFSTIGQMAAGITHEINTPLTYVKGNFEMLQEDIEKIQDEPLKQSMLNDATSIKSGLNRIIKIIDAMREVSQKNSEKKEVVNLFDTLYSSLVISYNRAKQIVQIKINDKIFDLDYVKNTSMSYPVYIQKQRVEQVWIIIINNALDELVKINNFEQRKFNINIQNNQEFVTVKFIDNAGGIDKEMLPNIFEPFESTKESSGIGIGLNIAKKIVEEQRGSIKAYNNEEGAVFEVILPLDKESSDE